MWLFLAGAAGALLLSVVGILVALRSLGDDKVATSGPVAKGNTSPETVKDVLPKVNTKPETKRDVGPPTPMMVHRSQAIGGSEGGEPFEDTGGQGAFLIGFAAKTRFQGNRKEIAFLQPIYWTPAGRKMSVTGFGHQPDSQAYPNVEAKDGYAVGGLMVWSNEFGGFHLVRGMSILFMRRKDQVLDPRDSYWSEWIGLTVKGKG